MFLLSFFKGSKSAEGGKNPLADMDLRVHIRKRIWTGGSNSRGSKSTRTPALKCFDQFGIEYKIVDFSRP